MADVVLLYQLSCPNVPSARANLMRAFSKASVPASWRELDLDAAETPGAWRGFGSPTILVDGKDVGDGAPQSGATCRVYDDGGRTAGAPSVQAIAASLAAAPTPLPPVAAAAEASSAPVSPRSVGSVFAALPGVVVALLPKGMCPACWPAYAAVLSALGLGFLMQDRYLLPLTIVFLALATLALTYRARVRRGFGPAIAGGLAGVVLLVGKFVLEMPMIAYAGIAAFTVAAVWNAWPIRRASCPACIPPTSLSSRS